MLKKINKISYVSNDPKQKKYSNNSTIATEQIEKNKVTL